MYEQGEMIKELRRRPPPSGPPPPRWPPPNVWVAYVIASVLFAILAVQGWRLVELQLQTELDEPQLNLAFVYLLPEGQGFRGETPTRNRIPAGRRVVLILSPLGDVRDDQVFSQLVFKVIGSDGRVVLRNEGLFMDEDGTVILDTAKDFLPVGTYSIVLIGVDEGRREILATYWVEVR